MNEILAAVQAWLLSNGVKVLIILVGAYIIRWMLRFVIKKAEEKIVKAELIDKERRKRLESLMSVVHNLVYFLFWGLVGIIILNQIGVKIGAILAGVGIIGLAVGFGAQSLVKDTINGVFILLENQYRVGDVVKIGDNAGLVEAITLRITVLRDLEGRVHYIPNGNVNNVINFTKEWSRAVMDIGVAYKEDVDKVIQVITEVGDELRADPAFSERILEPIEVLGVDNFADSAVVIKAMIKTKPIQQWTVAREYRRRLKKRFDQEGIEIPFPHQSLYFGEASKPIEVSLIEKKSNK